MKRMIACINECIINFIASSVTIERCLKYNIPFYKRSGKKKAIR